MTRIKKLLAVFMVLAIMFSLSACGSFVAKMLKSALKIGDLKSWRMDLDVDVGMSMSMLGDAMDIDTAVTGTIDVNASPVKAKADLTVDVMGETLNVLCYVEQAEKKLISYVSVDGGANWIKTEFDTETATQTQKMDAKAIAGLVKLITSFDQTGTEMVHGSEARVYSGFVTASDLETITDLSGAMNAMGDAMNTEIAADDLDLSSLSPIPLTICVDQQTGMIVKCSVDLTGLMQSLLPIVIQAAMQAAMAESGLGVLGGMDLSMLGFQLDISRLIVTAEFYDFDTVDDIVIPADALSAPNVAA